jgi:hypothetical protein
MFDGTTGAIVRADRIELHFVDGQRGDDDLAANGHIADVGGPGLTERPWQNPDLQFDVDNDRLVMPLDVLMLINEINADGPRSLPLVPQGLSRMPPYLDVSGDNFIAPSDVLLVINCINSRSAGSGEGDAVADSTSSPAFAGIPSFDVPPTAILPMGRLQQAGTTSKNADPRPTTVQSPASIQPANRDLENISLGTTIRGIQSHIRRARRTVAPDDAGRALAGLDAILSDIAEDVFHGWGQFVGDR